MFKQLTVTNYYSLMLLCFQYSEHIFEVELNPSLSRGCWYFANAKLKCAMCCTLEVVSGGLTEHNCVCGRGALSHCMVGVMQPQSGRKSVSPDTAPCVFMSRKETFPSCFPSCLQVRWSSSWSGYPAQPVFVPSARHLSHWFFNSQAVNTKNDK